MKKIVLMTCAIATIWSIQAPRAHAAFSSDIVSRAVRVFFAEAPIMVEVARCESTLRQYDESGETLRGGYNGKMIGLFQINETFHRDEARARGYNIDTLVGNMGYARELYREQGTAPWEPSAHCWASAAATTQPELVSPVLATTLTQSAVVPATSTQASTTERALEVVSSSKKQTLLTKNLKYGSIDPEVRILQRALNRAGYQVTLPGAETTRFGIATYKALVKFQCEQDTACKTKPETKKNIGRTDAATREVINKQLGLLS
jgi:Putative peptidoglycan binding domain